MTTDTPPRDVTEADFQRAAEEENRLISSNPAVLAATVQHLQQRVVELNIVSHRQAERIVEMETALRTSGVAPETDPEED